MKFLYKLIILMFVLSYSCSESTSPEDIPPLGDFLYGKYVDVIAYWTEYSEPGNPIHIAESTNSTELILNSNGEYSMELKLYIEYLDTILSLFQYGIFITEETEYVDTNEPLTYPTWNGTIVFSPNEDSVWTAKFSIASSTKDLFFDQWPRLELPDSNGWFIIRNWYRNKRL